MPISMPKEMKCPKCKKRIIVMIGDVRPQRVECIYCGRVWVIK